jgi:hypothetical protein
MLTAPGFSKQTSGWKCTTWECRADIGFEIFPSGFGRSRVVVELSSMLRQRSFVHVPSWLVGAEVSEKI